LNHVSLCNEIPESLVRYKKLDYLQKIDYPRKVMKK